MKSVLFPYNLILCFSILASSLGAQNMWYENRHSTNAQDAWLSCAASANPNSARGVSHWIRYDLGYVYTLNASRIWNYNVPNQTGNGIQQAAIDISTDGTNWTHVGNFNFPQANASGFYEGSDGPDFAMAQARYILITALNNYGGSCYGLAEIKVNVANSPLPVSLLAMDVECRDIPVLHWSTAGESNNDYFEIQYSENTVEWKTYQKVKGAGNTQKRTNYSQNLDIPRTSLTYVRLLQVDLDGREHILPLIKIDCHNRDSSLQIYPNPAVERIQIQSNEVQINSYRILASDGRVVKSGIMSERSSISLADLRPGNYFIGLETGEGMIYREFVKM
jgi:hypothetical protein